jgi:hypothetical protein
MYRARPLGDIPDATMRSDDKIENEQYASLSNSSRDCTITGMIRHGVETRTAIDILAQAVVDSARNSKRSGIVSGTEPAIDDTVSTARGDTVRSDDEGAVENVTDKGVIAGGIDDDSTGKDSATVTTTAARYAAIVVT